MEPNNAGVMWKAVAYFVGVAVSIGFPYFLAWLEKGEPFDWRQNVGRFLTAMVGLVPVLATTEFTQQLGSWSYVAALAAGLAFSQIGRMAQKTFDVTRKGSRALRGIS